MILPPYGSPFLYKLYSVAVFNRYTLKKYISAYGLHTTSVAVELKRDASLKSLFEEVVNSGECLFRKDLKITGADLKAIGIPEGREMGRILEDLFDMVLKNQVDNKTEELIKIARSL